MDEAGVTQSDLAPHLKVDPVDIASWISETTRPSRGQLTKLAAFLRRPAAVFFLADPPISSGMPPSLRQGRGRDSRDLNIKERQQVRRARRLQRLISWILQEQDATAADIPLVRALEQSPEDAGQVLRRWVSVSLAKQLDWNSLKEALDEWRRKLEDLGVLVMQLRLGSGEFRGFSVFDEFAPIMAINTADNQQARVFTLFHELAHLASRTDVACLARPFDSDHDADLERWCEEVASAVLLPPMALGEMVSAVRKSAVAVDDDFEVVSIVADRFKVSLRACAVAMIRQELVEREVYDDIEDRAPILEREKDFGRSAQAKRAPELRVGEFGARATALLVEALNARLLTEREARDYTRLDGFGLQEMAAQLGTSA